MDHIPGSLCSLVPLRFLCDEMLRGVGDWLRVAGYDTLAPAEGAPDTQVLAVALAQDRWLITRDRGLYQQPGAASHVILLETDNLQANLRELAVRLDIDWLHRPFTRCKKCNTLLATDRLPSSRDRIPADVAGGNKPLRYCPTCDRFFWEGSHVKRMRRQLVALNRCRAK